ncbi:MAG: hypothetical protein RID91_19700 [Azospirillaceae bacterium]
MSQKPAEYRSLMALERTASSSRVLNLNLLTRRILEDDAERAYRPFFRNEELNYCLVTKARLQGSESDLFEDKRFHATKVIFPYNRMSLKDGGKSIFLGQEHLEKVFKDHLGIDIFDIDENTRRDIELMEAIDWLPTLDPFLLKERLRTLGYEPDDAYFSLSPREWERIRAFVMEEFTPLAELAFSGFSNGSSKARTIIDRLWDGRDPEIIRPLIDALHIDMSEAADTLFAWKGFVYYKYLTTTIRGDVRLMRDGLSEVRVFGYRDLEEKQALNGLVRRVIDGLETASTTIDRRLDAYNKAYHYELVKMRRPQEFRCFLAGASAQFNELGAIIAGLAHTTAFWKWKYHRPEPPMVHADELGELLTDFDASVIH